MSQFMLYAHRNTASDNMVRWERKINKREESKNTGYPRFILWISRQKVYCLIELELTLNLRVFFLWFSLFWLQNNRKPGIPSDNLVHAGRTLISVPTINLSWLLSCPPGEYELVFFTPINQRYCVLILRCRSGNSNWINRLSVRSKLSKMSNEKNKSRWNGLMWCCKIVKLRHFKG